MPKKLKAETLVRTHPNVFKRRQELLLAFLSGGVGMMSHYNTNPENYADFAVRVVNKIIERTEQ